MKKPRVEDFDPNATPKLGSPLDGMPAIKPSRRESGEGTPQVAVDQVSPDQVEFQTSVPTEVRPSVLPYVRTGKRRIITRYAFEFYQDQIEQLQRFSLEEKFQGEKGSMSQMVREAIDMYIAKRLRTEE